MTFSLFSPAPPWDTYSRSTRARPARARSSSTARGRSGGRPAGVPPDLPAARLGGARPGRDLGTQLARRARGARASAGIDGGATSPPSASPTSARRRCVWDRATGEPIAQRDRLAGPAHRRRSATSCAQRGLEPTLRANDRAGARRLLLRHQARVAARQRRPARARAPRRGELAFGTVDTWLIWQAHRRRRARHRRRRNASRTLLFDIHARRLGRRAAATCSTSRARCCPRCRVERASAARTTPTCSAAPMPIAGIAGDQQAALFGQALLRRRAWRRTPTAPAASCSMQHRQRRPMPSTQRPAHDGRVRSATARRDYALEGSVFIARRGRAVAARRARRSSRPRRSRGARGAACPTTAACIFVPAFTGLGAPHWDPYARGAIVGLTRGTTARHIARAALESDRLPERRRARGDGSSDAAASAGRSCASTAAPPPTTC